MKDVKLLTPVVAPSAPFLIAPDDKILLMGSCFTEHIGARLMQSGFVTMSNPYGITYNPLSMADAMLRGLDCKELEETDLVQRDGLWHSWHHHGAFSHADKSECLAACHESLVRFHAFLDGCDVVMLTFGSAWHYRLATSGMVVNNCHKVPSSSFTKQMASVDQMVTAWMPVMKRLLAMGKRVVLTVSPVRHGAYGAHGNQVGKAVLLLAIDQLLAALADEGSRLYYFPAYEIMMDELRDYRFYADDMLHPSSLAVEIIWRRFQSALMSQQTADACDLREQELRRSAHRPIHSSGNP